MWIFGRKGPSGFSYRSTAEEVTQGIDGTGLTAIVTGLLFPSFFLATAEFFFCWSVPVIFYSIICLVDGRLTGKEGRSFLF